MTAPEPGRGQASALEPGAGQAPAPRLPECHDQVCITCSDEAVQVRVIELGEGDLAMVATEAGPEQVSVALVDARPGDLILVHAKEALAVLDRAP